MHTVFYFLIAFVIAAGDQLFKAWVIANIPMGGHMPMLDGIVSLTYVQNTGAAFSMLSDARWILLPMTLVLIGLLVVIIIRFKLRLSERLCLACVLGGAVGNGLDRVILGYVVDMFKLEFMDFAIFNIADCFITCGGILFCAIFILFPKKTAIESAAGRMPELERLRTAAEEKNDTDSM